MLENEDKEHTRSVSNGGETKQSTQERERRE